MEVLLATAAYVPNPDHNFVSDVTNELAGGTYVRKVLTGRAVVEDDVNDRCLLTADDTAWPLLAAGGATAAWAVVYEQLGGADAANPLGPIFDIADTVTDGDDFTIDWDALGLIIVTQGP